ncbi:glycosyltransferase family 4 protein [Archangium gephyra]|nr:glycosyltransferase family 4 protein [Archangium gephyra]
MYRRAPHPRRPGERHGHLRGRAGQGARGAHVVGAVGERAHGGAARALPVPGNPPGGRGEAAARHTGAAPAGAGVPARGDALPAGGTGPLGHHLPGSDLLPGQHGPSQLRHLPELPGALVRLAARGAGGDRHLGAQPPGDPLRVPPPPERVHVVYHGVDAETFRARDEQGNRRVLESRGIHGPFFLYAGSDHTHKNLRLLVEGYQMFRARWRGQTPPPSLVFMGPCSQVRGALYRETTWPEGVMYLGLLPASEVRVFFQEALAYVYPTTYEGFGLPVLEAMAAGTPVLCSSLTSVPEVAGEAGLYLREFSPEEVSRRLSELATDAGLRRRLVEAGHQQVKRFTWKETARRTEEVYLSAIDGTPEVSLRQKQAFSTLFARSLDAEARARAAEQRVHELEEKLALASLPGFGLVEPLVKAVARRKAKRE